MKSPDGIPINSSALIITQDEMLFQELEEKLKSIHSFSTIQVLHDCLDGILYAQKNTPDLVIFDTEVSVLEVLNALRAIKTHAHQIRCVVIADHIGYHALLSMVGADKILYKGFSQAELACSLN